MATPSQTGKVPPRAIASRGEDSKSPRALAVAAATASTLAAVAAVAAAANVAVRSTQGDAPLPGVGIATVVSIGPLVAAAAISIVIALIRPAVAGAVVAGFGAVAAGMTVIDVTLLRAPIDANRLELFRPATAGELAPSTGTYLVLAAHGVAALAGILGLAAINRASYGDGYGLSRRADLAGRAAAVRIGGVVSGVAVLAAVAAGVSMFAPPYVSTDSVVLVPAIVESPLTTAIGSGVVALAALVVVAAALASVSPGVAAGAIGGLGLGLFGIFATRVVAGSATGSGIEASTASWVGTAASLVLVAVGAGIVPVAMLRDRRGSVDSPRAGVPGVRADRSSGPASGWHVVAGLLGAAAGVLLIAGGLLPVLDVPAGLPEPTIYATRTSVVAGFVLVLAAVPLFFSLFAAVVRPAFGVLTVAAVTAAAGVLQSAVLAADIDGIGLGVGGIATGVGVLLAVASGLSVLLAGGAERDDVDTSDLSAHRPTAAVAVTGAVLASAGLALPLYRGADVTAASFLQSPWGAQGWGWDGWGQAILAATVLVAAVVAARSRPARGAALLAGSSIAVVLYLLGWPLTKGRALDPVVGPGVWFGAAGVVILAAAAILSARRRQS